MHSVDSTLHLDLSLSLPAARLEGPLCLSSSKLSLIRPFFGGGGRRAGYVGVVGDGATQYQDRRGAQRRGGTLYFVLYLLL